MRFYGKLLLIVQILTGGAFVFSADALTLKEIRSTRDLTPDTFAAMFSNFAFKFHDDVQDFERFLATKSGDCDDYATLAADVLKQRGYTPRLIAVRMKGETHVVCYIEETNSYLDYNSRKDAQRTVPCSSELTDIARSVAASFCKDWIATYEFTYSKREKVKRLVNDIVYQPTDKQQKPA